MSEATAAPVSGAQAPGQGATPGVPGQTSVTAGKEQAGGAAQNASQEQPQFYEVKINGQNRRMSLDQLKNMAMMGGAATEKFQQAAEKERKHAQWKEMAQKDFLQALQDPELGLSREQIRDRFEGWYKENFIDPETMTKEQREALQWKKKAEEGEKYKKDQEEKFKTWQEQQQIEQAKQQLQTEIIQTLEKSGLPKTRFTASRLAYWKQQNLRGGYDAPPEVLIQQVKDEGQSILKAHIGEATPQQIVEFLGDDLIKKVRAYDIEQLKARRGGQQTEKTAPPTQSANRRTGGKSMREVDQYFNNLRRSR